MSILSVTNLKKIEIWNFVRRKCEENWENFRTNISRSAEAISLNFYMYSSVYVKHKIYKFYRNQLSSFGDTES